jgi:hypothetical protein
MKSGEELYTLLNRPSRARTPHRDPPSDSRLLKRTRFEIPGTPVFRPVPTFQSSSHSSPIAALRKWINQDDPTPFDILRAIAQISPIHQNILTRIADELESVMSIPHPPSPHIGRGSKISASLLEGYDLQVEIEKLGNEELEMRDRLKELNREKTEFETVLAERRRLLAKHAFDRYAIKKAERDQLERELKEQLINKKKHDATLMFTRLWGEGRHLRDELSKCVQALDAEREIHIKLADNRAQSVVAAAESEAENVI